MKHIVIFCTFFYISLQAATPVDTNASQENNETGLTKIHIPTFYKDYKWDVGVTGGLTFDGTQVDIQRYSILAGVHGAYHLNDAVSFHGEYFRSLATIAGSQYSSDQKEIFEDLQIDTVAVSVAYDFSAERTYSLFVKAGLGYEMLEAGFDTTDGAEKNTISLMGFGFRYMFTERISGYVEGRWKMRLNNMSEPDNALMGNIGFDYHFGLDDKKAQLIAEADKHNAEIDALLKEREEAQRQKALKVETVK